MSHFPADFVLCDEGPFAVPGWDVQWWRSEDRQEWGLLAVSVRQVEGRRAWVSFPVSFRLAEHENAPEFLARRLDLKMELLSSKEGT